MPLTNGQWDDVKRHLMVQHELGLSILEDELGVDDWRWYLDMVGFPPRLTLTFEGGGRASPEDKRLFYTRAKSLAARLQLRLWDDVWNNAEDVVITLRPRYWEFEQ